MARQYRFIWLAAVLLTTVGCGTEKFHPVSGQLVYPDGSPVTELEGGTVIFEGADASGKGYSASGAIGADGRFTLTTEKPGDGAVAGANRVMVQPQVLAPDKPPRRVILPKYDSAETSGLTVEVKPGPNDVKLKVEPVKGGKAKD